MKDLKKKYIKKKKKLFKTSFYNKKNIFYKICIKILKMKTFKIKKNNKGIKETIYIEIRNGLGGDESCMFVEEILKMYTKYFTNNYIIYEIFYKKKGKKGIKRIILRVENKNIYSKFFFEIGVHRVQRIPKNDAKKRMHTSTCIVDVIKEFNESEISFKRKDLKIDTFKSSGAGGQSVNKTNSAVRIKHIPTNISVECQKERSQMENKKFALKLLISKIKEIENKKKNEKINNKRNKLKNIYSIRSSKIRTYNYSRNIIRDHFLKKSFNNLKKIINEGRMDIIFKKNKLIKNSNVII
ncbi:peptide chain release factor-like protein [Candidatus Vidania fulgoroideorum]